MRIRQWAIRILLAVLLTALSVIPGIAQEPPAETGVEISWPPPVSEVWGSGDVTGTANVPNMSYFYLEYLTLNDDLTMPDGAPWIPTTVGMREPVSNGVLATLDTTTVPDGLYALRLVVNTTDNQTFYDVVSPVRVSNNKFDRIITAVIAQALEEAGVVPAPTPEPPTPTPVVDMTPRVFPTDGVTAVNLRRCDVVDNHGCAVVGYLTGEGGTIFGVSNRGTGWYQVLLPTGLAGWVSPTVVYTTGDLNNIPPVEPPAPLPPPAESNIQLSGLQIQGNAVCAQTFNVHINVGNVGNAPSPAGDITLQDVNIRTGQVTYTNYGSFPSIAPGANYVVVIPVTTSAFFNETHELRAFAGNKQVNGQYTLQQGDCGGTTPPTAAPPPTAVPPTAIPPTPLPPPNPGREFGQNECFIVLTNPKAIFDAPYGNSRGTLDPAPYSAIRIVQAEGADWYLINTDAFGEVWIAGAGTDKQGDCGLTDN
ncbi:MAG: hypothetical protein H6670_03700 [Anaerolineaceae bacterium]|nr:hypothetical protein [Anaerolineaceae bacterium]